MIMTMLIIIIIIIISYNLRLKVVPQGPREVLLFESLTGQNVS